MVSSIHHVSFLGNHTVSLEIDGRGVATATLSRPERHNALDESLIADLGLAMDEIEGSACTGMVRAMVLTGAGESFCAGGDLDWMRRQVPMTHAERVESSGTLATLFGRLDRLPVVTIARVNGPAYGGGVGLVACCDIAIGGPAAKFALTEVSLGLAPSNISPFVVRRIGVGHARRTFLNAAPIDASMAFRIGLLSEIADDLDAAVETEIRRVLRCGPHAVGAAKRLIEYVDTHTDDDNRIYTADDLAAAWEREEGREGISAFLEKRPPAYRASADPSR